MVSRLITLLSLLLVLANITPALAEIGINTDKSVYLVTEPIIVTLSGVTPPGDDKSLLDIRRVDGSSEGTSSGNHSGPLGNGSYPFKAPWRPGEFVVRYYPEWPPVDSTRAISSAPFTVRLHTDGPFSLDLSAKAIPPGGELTVRLEPHTGFAESSWLSIFPEGAEGTYANALDHDFLHDSPDGSYTFKGPTEPGRYQVRLIAAGHSDSLELAAVPFEVTPPVGGQIALARHVFEPGERLRVAFERPEHGLVSGSWVGLFATDNNEEQEEGRPVASLLLSDGAFLDFAAPNRHGRYEARLHRSKQGPIAQRIPFTVVAHGTSDEQTRLDAGYAGERILDFHSDIIVAPDGDLTVTETIRVWAEHYNIKHGIYRDLPTRYDWLAGLQQVRGFEVLAVKRNRQDEPWFSKQLEHGRRIYMGSEDALVTPGEHVYELTYTTDGQIGFFADHDELYWNVTGNGWEFPISRASATVHLPSAAKVLRHNAYTGPQGAQGDDFRYYLDAQGRPNFATTQPLGHHEGLTLVVAWPKGIVAPPTFWMQTLSLLRNLNALMAVLVLTGFVIVYYLVAWYRVGRDPRKDPIVVVRYEPPIDETGGNSTPLDPATLRYLRQGGWDNLCFTVAIIGLAAKGYLRLRREKDGALILFVRTAPPDGLPRTPVESTLYYHLAAIGNEIHLSPSSGILQLAQKKFYEQLRTLVEKLYYRTNVRLWGGGFVLSIIAGLIGTSMMTSNAHFGAVAAPLLFGAPLVALGVYLLSFELRRSWLALRAQISVLKLLAFFWEIILMIIMIGALGVLTVGGLSMEAFRFSPIMVVILAIMMLVNLVFFFLLRAYTPLGRRLLDQAEGFRRFLATAEEERFEALHPPERTPALFERYLPYAVALGCENRWARQFEQLLKETMIVDDHRIDPSLSEDVGGLTAPGLLDLLGSGLTESLSSAASAPGSSSGFGGGGSSSGGSSGGGGGGGGGGGW